MSALNQKKILLGVSGGIAAYKSADLVRRLKEQGAQVRVVMTDGAQTFVTPLTFQAVSGEPVHTDLLNADAEAAMGHIELARWADAVLIAPASADVMARIAGGLANDLLSTIVLATNAPVMVAPAMNQQMWANSATQENLQRLQARGIKVFGPGSGSQACGEVGLGRMLEPTELAALLSAHFADKLLAGLKVVITAGPTREAIDPVRYLSNHSSGKMGYALAEAALNAGAQVILVSGPVALAAPIGCQAVMIDSAEQMKAAVFAEINDAHVFIACAAVADYRAETVAAQKIKKTGDTLTLTLVKNPDILSEVSALAKRPLCVGFAAETENVLAHATSKLERKKLDMIFANDVSRSDIGFGCENNAITALIRDGNNVNQIELPSQHKRSLAQALIRLVAQEFKKQHG